MPALTVEVQSDDEHLLVTLRGELDIATIPELGRRMAEIRREAPHVVVIDASGLAFVGVRGLRALTAEMHALRHGRRDVSVVNEQPQLRRLAELLFAQAQLGWTCERR